MEIEIGSGDGTFLLHALRQRPDVLLLGIEWSSGKVRRLAPRLARLGTPRVRLLRADAVCVVSHLIPTGTIEAYHVYFPDPWPKRRHAERRLFSRAVIAHIARTLRPGGRLFVATDVASYHAEIRARVVASGSFAERASDAAHPGLATGFARKYSAAGRPLYVATFDRVQVAAGPGVTDGPTA